ncbi:hypothetical protein [Pseudoduganella lurida]|uniref:hypothetical protein n=1 Tax=Pseudoduganella lurida TaxID=1036180 RepID=UPI0011A5878E|nr:hypothetical protein [Pseudoduganella lurida]
MTAMRVKRLRRAAVSQMVRRVQPTYTSEGSVPPLEPVQRRVNEQLTAMGLAGVNTRNQFNRSVFGIQKSSKASNNRIMDQMEPELVYVVQVDAIAVRRRSWPHRFIRSYLGWRQRLGIVLSLRAAWVISRAAPLPPVDPADPRSRPGRSWHEDAGWKYSEG